MPAVAALSLRCLPLTPERWDDLVDLFQSDRWTRGCFDMWPRQTGKVTNQRWGAGNREAFEELVGAGPPPGLLAYEDGRAVGWMAIGPRSDYSRVQRSRLLAPVDDRPTWAVVCFFVRENARGAGVAAALLKAGVGWARERDAKLVEGYAVRPEVGSTDPASLWWGTVELFEKAGFKEIKRASARRSIMRLML